MVWNKMHDLMNNTRGKSTNSISCIFHSALWYFFVEMFNGFSINEFFDRDDIALIAAAYS